MIEPVYTDSKRKRIVASVLLPLCYVAAQSGAVAKLQPAPKEKTEAVHCESGDTGSVFW